MTRHIKLLLRTAAILAVATAAPSFAGEFAPVSTEAFQAAMAAKRPIVFHVRTQNGAICTAQHAVLEKLMAEPAYKDYLVLEVDFVANPQAVKMLNAQTPATLIFDRAGTNMGRVQGVIDEAAIRALLSKTKP